MAGESLYDDGRCLLNEEVCGCRATTFPWERRPYAVMRAAEQGQYAGVELLVDLGFDVNAADPRRRVPCIMRPWTGAWSWWGC